jgi:hypothetical protein
VHRLANALVEQGESVLCYSFSPKPIDALYDHQQLHAQGKNFIIMATITCAKGAGGGSGHFMDRRFLKRVLPHSRYGCCIRRFFTFLNG